jgi:phosphoribosylformylglycinamidine cyclo-ligase
MADNKLSVGDRFDELSGTLGEALLTPTRIYVKGVLALAQATGVLSCVHITGGGFYENIPRGLPEGLSARIEKGKIPVPPVFGVLQKLGGVPERDMYNTFNMGAGMFVFVPAAAADAAARALIQAGETAVICGEVVPGAREVQLC